HRDAPGHQRDPQAHAHPSHQDRAQFALAVEIAARQSPRRPCTRSRMMPEQKTRTMQAHLGMLLWALFVGLSFPAVGLLSEGLPPLLRPSRGFAIAALGVPPWPGKPR